jgi:lipopolysaccharide transport system permease protein
MSLSESTLEMDLPIAAEEPSTDAAPPLAAGSDAPHHEPHLTVIQARPGWQIVDFGEIWRFRELLCFLVWRDVKVRYKQTVLGAAWAILQPTAQMVVFSIFFGRMAEVATDGIPYPLFAFAGLLPWMFFQNSITNASQSVVGNQNLITKVYFPRLFIPASAIGAAIVDFAIACGMLLALMAWYGAAPTFAILLAPLIALGLAAAAFGVGTLLSALTVAYRDFRYVVPWMVQLWMFATPTVYMDASVTGPRWQLVLPLNPAYGLIHNFRCVTLGRPMDWYALGVSLAVTALFVVAGCLYFRRVERTFADII